MPVSKAAFSNVIIKKVKSKFCSFKLSSSPSFRNDDKIIGLTEVPVVTKTLFDLKKNLFPNLA